MSTPMCVYVHTDFMTIIWRYYEICVELTINNPFILCNFLLYKFQTYTHNTMWFKNVSQGLI